MPSLVQSHRLLTLSAQTKEEPDAEETSPGLQHGDTTAAAATSRAKAAGGHRWEGVGLGMGLNGADQAHFTRGGSGPLATPCLCGKKGHSEARGLPMLEERGRGTAAKGEGTAERHNMIDAHKHRNHVFGNKMLFTEGTRPFLCYHALLWKPGFCYSFQCHTA